MQWESQSSVVYGTTKTKKKRFYGRDEKYNLEPKENGSMGTHKGTWTLNQRVNKHTGQETNRIKCLEISQTAFGSQCGYW